MTSGDGEQDAVQVQVRGTVLTVRKVDAYYAMTVVAPGIAARFRPGQFVAVAVGGPDTSMLLRRAFSIHDVRPDHGGTVEFVFAPVGPGTRWLAERRTRDVLDLAGPLGRPFPVPRDPVSCLLVGGGYGSAPLFPLAGRLRKRDCQVDFLLGAASADRVFGALTARRTGRTAAVTTEDGSMGIRGLVTDRLTQVIHEARTDVIYACGPMGMLRQVTALAQRYEIPVLTLVEESMACGIGVCMTCVLPVVGDDGVTRMVRSCVAGPVFRGDSVRWDDVGTIPFDALGAPGWNPRPSAAARGGANSTTTPTGTAGTISISSPTGTANTSSPTGTQRPGNSASTTTPSGRDARGSASSAGPSRRDQRGSASSVAPSGRDARRSSLTNTSSTTSIHNPRGTANTTNSVSGTATGGVAWKERHGG